MSVLFRVKKDGVEGWADLNELKLIDPSGPDEPDEPDEPDFFDDFKLLSVEDGQKPHTGKTWCDSFPKDDKGRWGVRKLQANGDIVTKIFDPANPKLTHELTPNGIALRCSKKGNVWVGGCLYAWHTYAYMYGTLEFRMRVNSFGPGIHLSVCNFAKSGNHPPEQDALEIIGSNGHFKDGPFAPYLFFNDHSTPNAQKWFEVAMDFYRGWHNYKMVWCKDAISWHVDGHEYMRIKNNTHEKMVPGIFFEGGHNEKEDFPGRINTKTPSVNEVEISSIGVWRHKT
jgi:hypothetical protein